MSGRGWILWDTDCSAEPASWYGRYGTGIQRICEQSRGCSSFASAPIDVFSEIEVQKRGHQRYAAAAVAPPAFDKMRRRWWTVRRLLSLY